MIRLHIIRTIIFALIGLGVGFFILSQSAKVYEGRVQLVLGGQGQNGGRFYSSTLNEDVANILQTGLATNPQTEAQILRGEGVFRDALQRVASQTSDAKMVQDFDDYYRMYDVQSSTDASAALIKARAYDPQKASMLANSIAEAYNERRQQNQREAVARALRYLEDQIVKSKQDLEKAEMAFTKEKKTNGMPDAAATITRDVEYQAQLRASLDTARAELAGVDKQIDQINSEMRTRPQYEEGDSSEQKNQTLQQLENQLADQERQKQTMLIDYYPDAVPVKLIQGSINSLKSQIKALKAGGFENTVKNKRVDSIRRTLDARLSEANIAKQGLLERISKVQATYTNHLAKIDTLPDASKRLIDLAREVEVTDSNYKRLRLQAEDLKNRTEVTARAAQIVYDSIPDQTPVLPKPAVVYVVSVLGGAILGLLISFAIEAMRLRIYSSTQLQELTGLPVVGVVHDLPGPTARKLLTSVREPNPLVSESYRFLAFAAMTKKQEGPRRILLTGVDNNAGCSTTAAQFATALAHTGSRVILMDCALEDPTITRVFGLEQKSGVSDILGQTQLPSADSSFGTDTPTPNLRVVGAGTEAKNSIKVAPTQNINGMIGAASAACDVVVIDSMPCLVSSDAARLVPYVDEVYLVVSAKTANMRNVAAAIDVLTLASAASIKFVVTKGSRGEEAVMRQANLASARV